MDLQFSRSYTNIKFKYKSQVTKLDISMLKLDSPRKRLL